MIAFARPNTSSTRKRTVAAAALSAAFLVLAFPGIGHAQQGGQDKVTLCHQTGNGSYETITVSSSGAKNGHGKHDGDIIPAPPGGCPTPAPAPAETTSDNEPAPTASPAATPARPSGAPARDKVSVCHLTGNGSYTVINIAEAGWDNGHSKHEGDILLLDGAGTESCDDARATLDATASGTAGVFGVSVESLVPAVPAAPQDGQVTICHMTQSDGYVKITLPQAGWDNGHATHADDIMLTGSATTASCDDAHSTLESAAAGMAGIAGIDVASLVPAVPAQAADPVLANTGSEHTNMGLAGAAALLAGIALVRLGKDRVAV